MADTYSAITMERSYKATRNYEEALSELRLAAGSQLDSELVDIFCRIPQSAVEKAFEEVMEKMQGYQEESFRD